MVLLGVCIHQSAIIEVRNHTWAADSNSRINESFFFVIEAPPTRNPLIHVSLRVPYVSDMLLFSNKMKNTIHFPVRGILCKVRNLQLGGAVLMAHSCTTNVKKKGQTQPQYSEEKQQQDKSPFSPLQPQAPQATQGVQNEMRDNEETKRGGAKGSSPTNLQQRKARGPLPFVGNHPLTSCGEHGSLWDKLRADLARQAPNSLLFFSFLFYFFSFLPSQSNDQALKNRLVFSFIYTAPCIGAKNLSCDKPSVDVTREGKREIKKERGDPFWNSSLEYRLCSFSSPTAYLAFFINYYTKHTFLKIT